MLIQHSVLTPLLTASPGGSRDSLLLNRDSSNPNLLNGNAGRDAILLSRNDTTILLNSDSQLLSSDRVLSVEGQLSNKNQLLSASSPLLSTAVGVLNSNVGGPVLLNQANNGSLLHSPSNTLLTQSPQRSSPSAGVAGGQNGSSINQNGGVLSGTYF